MDDFAVILLYARHGVNDICNLGLHLLFRKSQFHTEAARVYISFG